MAVPEQTPYKEYTANGTTTEFPTTFDCEFKDHLIVMVDDDEVEASTWQFLKNSSNLQGSIKFNHAPANGLKITIQRNSPARRESQYSSYNNSFRPQAINEDLDRIWRKLQEFVVADILMKLYVDRLHTNQQSDINNKDQILRGIINDLRQYVDRQDNNRNQYFESLIRKQGVALDQLDDYYKHLLHGIADIAAEKGWLASLVVDESGLSQQIYNRMIKNAILTKKNLRDLGFKGDGSDESTLLQTVFNEINGVDLDFGGLTISVAKQVNLSGKERFKLRNGEVRATDNFKSDVHVQPVVNISRSSHWSIYDFDFDGNRFNRVQPTGPAEPVWHSLQIYGGCKNFYMQNVNLKDGMMENLYICGGTQPNWDDIPTGGTFVNVNCAKGFRNSSAIIHGIDLTFIGSSFTGSYGNPAGPCAGMDIESNNDGGALSNIQFIACTFKDNKISQVQVSGKDYIRSIKFSGGTIDGGINPDSSPIVWYSSAAIFDGVTIRNFNKTTGDQVIRIPSSGAGRYPDQYIMKNCTLENIVTTKPLFYVHSHAGGLNLEGNTLRDIECQTIGHIFGGNNNISKNVFDGVVGKNWLYDYVDSGNTPINIFKDNVFKAVTGELRLSSTTFTGNTFIDCGTGSDVTYVARVTGQTSIADNNTFISTTPESAKKALVAVDALSVSYNKTYLYDNAYDISNTNESVFKTVQQSNQKDNVLIKTDSMFALGTTDLNTLYHQNAVYFQKVAANATLARNYPIARFYGKIEVIDIESSGNYVYCTQIATMAGSKQQWIRRGSKFGTGNINWQTWDLILNSSFNERGASSSRPTTNLFNGRMYLDTTLATAGKPIWYSEGQWVDSTGSVV